ncbi:bifunctional heparan sulfate N-deacetylase/N-sulfotransferase 4-like [Gordionus sp. m RMFG-2023]|uniref:bifunctional heparan sulfate N-deacetylase/N-sulfotransferase 4-like n=1 Tax=Gordionus sp. m RMFG-2023 TaxID=3053472 RepID=UPI0031FDD592
MSPDKYLKNYNEILKEKTLDTLSFQSYNKRFNFSNKFLNNFDFANAEHINDYCIKLNGFNVLIVSDPKLTSLTKDLERSLNYARLSYRVLDTDNFNPDTAVQQTPDKNKTLDKDFFVNYFTNYLKTNVIINKECFDIIIFENLMDYVNLINGIDYSEIQHEGVFDTINGNEFITKQTNQDVEYLRYYINLINPKLFLFIITTIQEVQNIVNFRSTKIKGIYVNKESQIPYILKLPVVDEHGPKLGKIYDEVFSVSDSIRSFTLTPNITYHWENEILAYTEDLAAKTQNKLPLIYYLKNLQSFTKLSDRILNQERIVFGARLQYWPFQILFHDCLLTLLKHSKLNDAKKLQLDKLKNKNRYFMIDIDDIFVGNDTNPSISDIKELIYFQTRIRKRGVKDFTINLGYSGDLYTNTKRSSQLGYDYLLNNSKHFNWFPHSFSHQQFHKANSTYLNWSMENNLLFAKKHNLSINTGYAVSPKHSGIYPIYNNLFKYWNKIFNITVTSTINYPYMYPKSQRKGFIFNGISVLPRQDLGLYSLQSTNKDLIRQSRSITPDLNHGYIFSSFFHNKVNVYMTHIPNFVNDHLAINVFEKILDTMRRHTNLIFKTNNPKNLANIYFTEYPQEKNPIWTNPCKDRNSLKLWNRPDDCHRFPKFVIVGPQKTGTTALLWFLSMNPYLKENKMTEYFEETQFFSGENYKKGIDWYLDLFMDDTNCSSNCTKSNIQYMEKSATYFDHSYAPERVSNLLPNTTIIVILTNPAERAYSWYQHMKAHNDPIATDFSFNSIVNFSVKSSGSVSNLSTKILKLQNRCLNPGKYVIHLYRWLEYFPPEQIVLVDGEKLKKDAPAEMTSLQNNLHLDAKINYKENLRFDTTKKFYCLKNNTKVKCMPKSKGRNYPPLDQTTRDFLDQYYKPYNTELKRWLNDRKFKRKVTPAWI